MSSEQNREHSASYSGCRAVVEGDSEGVEGERCESGEEVEGGRGGDGDGCSGAGDICESVRWRTRRESHFGRSNKERC